MIHQITGLPMLDKAKVTKTLGRVELAKKTLTKWYGKGMKISGITNMKLKFRIHVIAQKIYSSSHINSVSCEAIDLALKVMKNSMSFIL